ncbi:TPA: prepilin-type N-terminal cleavage/methylation domain-containing protein [Clostridioides difficile]|uniref:type II secretion system protein n=1 Tax=Clostridioides difficile TaxID=1496 RepID=UPI00093AFFEB|nr:prepilin-type N-terminal cleavage/methylation domain-containing protein [Clostridioides difficile]EGT3953343.1 prepilin-type N-terminal cleavage/methylation domain-containing protein [Clostridioides difficile]EGT5079905.1 prepilin-type N-terminal cleavage/methylation domain-containing protein [Clostridioides difficile]EGT5136412.1 prepilin-type N-terminal cleavage/methylation domain-containing protein [Clostridioides difficile]EGT5420901.1 prepilin-type N-terminal cleavage/methylation domain
MKLKKNKKGFTLVELLVVIAIIGILAVVAVPALFSNINKAKVASVESDYSSVKSAALSYYSDTNKIPVTPDGQTGLSVLETYMESLPDKADIGGKYKLIKVGNKLVLQIGKDTEGVTLTEAQSAKLLSDIGENKIYTSVTADNLGNPLTSNTKVDNKVLYIVLIDNTVMDSTK